MTKIISSPDKNLHLLPSKEVMVITGKLEKGASPSTPKVKPTDSREYQAWGEGNDYPTYVFGRCRANSIIPSTINWKSRALRSGGVRYGYIDGYKPDGSEIFIPVELPDVEEFIDRNDLDLYFEEAFSDLIWFSHFFPEMTMQPDRNKIVSLVTQEATFCRLKKQDKEGKIPSVLLDANWPNGKKETWNEVQVLDPYWDPVGTLRAAKYYRFMYPLNIPSPGKVYYQQPDWHSVIEGDWLEVANHVPKFKKHLMNNRMSLRWVVHVPDSWWEWKYPGFNSASGKYDEKKRKEIQANELTKFQNLLSGVEKQGRILIATYKTDQAGKDYTKWKFEAVDGKSESGEYMEESQEASSHILYALGVDGTLIGSAPGKQMGAGSGSDKRVAWNIFIINNKPLQDKVLRPLDLITKYNNWKTESGKKLVWRFNNYLIATLDTGSQVNPK